MEPNRFGRKLGIGVRVASRMVKERAAQANAAAASPAQPARQPSAEQRPATSNAARPQPASQPLKSYTDPARRVGVGTRQFGRAFLGPLASVSGTLWLEITGLFFALFAVFFAQNAYRVRASALHGPLHAQFLLYAIVTLVFLYFCFTSFLKASRRSRRARR